MHIKWRPWECKIRLELFDTVRIPASQALIEGSMMEREDIIVCLPPFKEKNKNRYRIMNIGFFGSVIRGGFTVLLRMNEY